MCDLLLTILIAKSYYLDAPQDSSTYVFINAYGKNVTLPAILIDFFN